MLKGKRHATRPDTFVSTRVVSHYRQPTRHDTHSYRSVSGVSLCEPDWSELKEREFTQCLKGIQSVQELEGVANRRKWLKAPQLKGWSEMHKRIILQRKWELEQKVKK